MCTNVGLNNYSYISKYFVIFLCRNIILLFWKWYQITNVTMLVAYVSMLLVYEYNLLLKKKLEICAWVLMYLLFIN